MKTLNKKTNTKNNVLLYKKLTDLEKKRNCTEQSKSKKEKLLGKTNDDQRNFLSLQLQTVLMELHLNQYYYKCGVQRIRNHIHPQSICDQIFLMVCDSVVESI